MRIGAGFTTLILTKDHTGWKDSTKTLRMWNIKNSDAIGNILLKAHYMLNRESFLDVTKPFDNILQFESLDPAI